MSSKLIYYVYAYLRSKDSETAKAGTPYYIGKGKGRRAFSKHNKINLPRDKSLIVFLETNLSEVGALALERRYIRWYGRKINNTGILLNISEGGHSSTGVSSWNKNIPQSEEIKNKISNTKKGVSSGTYYNNGITNILLKPNDSIPYGYIKGKLFSEKQNESFERCKIKGLSKESREKAINTMKKENRPEGFIHGNVGKTKTKWISNLELKISKQIKIAEEIPEGWIRGRKFNNIKKTVRPPKKWVHNPLTMERKQILIESEIPEGWLSGSGLKHTAESNALRKQYSSSRRWITELTTGKQIMINKKDIIPDGWVAGLKKVNHNITDLLAN